METLAQYAHPSKSEKLKVFPPQYGVHTQGHFEKKQTLHTTPKSSHTGELFENFQVFTHRDIGILETSELINSQRRKVMSAFDP